MAENMSPSRGKGGGAERYQQKTIEECSVLVVNYRIKES